LPYRNCPWPPHGLVDLGGKLKDSRAMKSKQSSRYSGYRFPSEIISYAIWTEEVQAWKDVFGIEQRYKAKLCSECDGKGWLIQALDEARNYMSPADYLIQKRRHATMLPLVDANFLRVPFLEACQAANLF
jgi:hypothetical protein